MILKRNLDKIIKIQNACDIICPSLGGVITDIIAGSQQMCTRIGRGHVRLRSITALEKGNNTLSIQTTRE